METLPFQWCVPEGGYKWTHKARPEPALGGDVRESGPFLIVANEMATLRGTFPLHDPGKDSTPLFRLFAALQPETEPILQFANQHG